MRLMNVHELSEINKARDVVESLEVKKIDDNYFKIVANMISKHEVTISKRHEKNIVKTYRSLNAMMADAKKIGINILNIEVS